jgi:broad specificity phosphatase PhoE
MTIWMIRHAQSQSNAGQATIGPSTNGLSDLGLLQSKQVAEVISQVPDRIVVSPYWRTHLTAQPLLDKFPQVKPEVWPVQEFSYLSLSPDHPTTPAHRQPLSQAFWNRSDPDYVDGERAESFQQLMQRVQDTLDRIDRHQGFGVVFSHGLFMKALLWTAMAQPGAIDKLAMQRFCGFWRSFRIPNASILRISVAENQQLTWSGFDIDHLPLHLREEAFVGELQGKLPTTNVADQLDVADQPS